MEVDSFRMSRLFESFEFLNRSWDTRILDGLSLRTALFLVSAAFLLAFAAKYGCRKFEKSLGRGLEAEKSYTRYAMEYYRAHPDERRASDRSPGDALHRLEMLRYATQGSSE